MPTEAAAPSNGPDHPHIGRVHFEVTRNTYGPGKFANCERMAERRTLPVTGIRQHTAKAHTGCEYTIELRHSHLQFRPCHSILDGNTRALQPSPIARPALGKEQPQCQHDRHFAARKRQRYQGLAIGSLAQCRSILRSDTHRMRAFLGHRGIVDHQHGVPAAYQLIRLDKQFGFYRRRIPDTRRNKVVQLIIFAKRKPLRHRLNALAITRTDQPRYVDGTHPAPRFMTKPIHKRLQPAPELSSPIRHACHGRPSKSRPPMNH